MKRMTIVAAFVAGVLAALSAFAQMETRTNTSGGVTVKVTPKVLAADAPTWEFAVVLDTHSQDLADDLTKAAAIVTPDGARYSPVAWDGAPPGGHHREGVLRFHPVTPTPSTVELQIQRAGESAPRVFRWDLK